VFTKRRLEGNPLAVVVDGEGLDEPSMQLRGLKASARPIPIIAVTGGAPRAPQGLSVDEAQKAGADQVLMKPVGREELLRAVADVTAGRTRDR
jgi:CheY-like chemotaxis protein